nr:SGNH hydrolase [uncultured bacterium]
MTRTRRIWLVLSLTLGLLLPAAWAAAQHTELKIKPKTAQKKDVGAKPASVVPVPRNDAWWQQRHKSMNERVAKGNVDLILIGDSITHGWEGAGKDVWKEFYGNRNAVNLGIGGDQTQHVIWRLRNGNIDNIKPKLAVVMIGTNNAGSGNKPEEVAAGVKAVVKTLRTRLPETKVLVLAIFPREAKPDGRLRQVNAKANELIAKLADDKDVFYLDIGKKFLEPDDTLTKEIMPDLLHLSPKGYRIWAEAIEPMVAKFVGPK